MCVGGGGASHTPLYGWLRALSHRLMLLDLLRTRCEIGTTIQQFDSLEVRPEAMLRHDVFCFLPLEVFRLRSLCDTRHADRRTGKAKRAAEPLGRAHRRLTP